jgi:hypothetical protein
MFYRILRGIDEDLELWVLENETTIILNLVCINYILFFAYYLTGLSVFNITLLFCMMLMVALSTGYIVRLDRRSYKDHHKLEEPEVMSEHDASYDTDPHLHEGLRHRCSHTAEAPSGALSGASTSEAVSKPLPDSLSEASTAEALSEALSEAPTPPVEPSVSE